MKERVKNYFGDSLGENWGWVLFGGILLMILGVVGLSMEVILSMVAVVTLGIFVIAASIIMFIGVFKVKGWKAKLWNLFIAFVYMIAGIILIVKPLNSAVWLTMFISVALIVMGIMRLIIAFDMRKTTDSGWGWTMFSGVSGIILGVLLLMDWPRSGLYTIGMFLSIDLIMQGVAWISVAIAAKKAKKGIEEGLDEIEKIETTIDNS